MRTFDFMSSKTLRAYRLALVFLLILTVAIPSATFATGSDPSADGVVTETEPVIYIYDQAGLFTQEQYENLQEQAMSVSNYSQCGVYFVAVDDYWDYSMAGDILTATEEIYHANGFGYGPEKNGILLLLSMSERDYALVTYGSFAHAAFTDYGQEVMCNNFLDDFANDHWYGGVLDYILDCENMTQMAMDGTPLDVQGPPEGSVYEDLYGPDPYYGDDYYYEESETSLFMAIPMALLPAAALSLVICLVLKRGMKTARKQVDAFEYIVGNSVDFRVRQDMFTHVTRRRRKINTNNGSKSGGGRSGGTTVRSSGFSGRSGKF